MLYRQLLLDLPHSRNFDFLASSDASFTFGQFSFQVTAFATALEPQAGKKIGLFLTDGPELVAMLFALDKLGCDAYLFGSENQPESVSTQCRELGVDLCFTDQQELPGTANFALLPKVPAGATLNVPSSENFKYSRKGHVVLFTSGTSGKPKGALHTWASLAAAIKVDERFRGSRWLLTYGLTRFAGVQVFLQAFLNKGCLVFSPSYQPSELINTLRRARVEYVSGTPTFWRKLLASAPVEQLRNIPLKQITLGGEIVGQGILNGLRNAFPDAQITHIYASTEMGVCFAVRDGLEGFPSSYLQPNSDVRMEIREGELFIQSQRAMKTYLSNDSAQTDQWFATGDLVEVRDNRVYFLGRRSEIINVGGSKVYPEEVEEQIRTVSGVRDVRVFGTKSSFAGSLVSAEVVPSPGVDQSTLKQAILERCNSFFPPHKRPRLITFIEQLKETASKKIARQ